MLLQIHNLNKTYGKEGHQTIAVSDVSFQVEEGEFIAILGPSGCGKSTLLHMLGGVDTPTHGSIFIDGEDITSMSVDELTIYRRHYIGLIYQFYNLLPILSVEENITLPLSLDYKEVDHKQLDSLLKRFQLVDRKKHLPAQLSGGQQQRTAIVRALITNPKIILADEPTGNLDSVNRQEVMNCLKEINETEKHTIIMVTHDIELAKQAKRILYMEDGKITKDQVQS